MHPKLSLKKKIYITMTLVMVISLLVLNSIYDVIHCNMRKDYKSINDRYFQDVKDKIVRLEKEKYKDATTISRLAEQYNLIGTFYLERHIWDLTIDSFDNSMKYGNRSADAFYSLGLAYANRGVEKNSTDDVNKAEYNYRKAIEINKNLFDAKYALAILLFYHREKGKDEAQTLINEILVKNHAYYPARFANGRFNYELGNKEKALTIYQELASDLNKLPPSGISNDYKKECSNNITRIMSELSIR
jgi:tetratricopeptide (TPR) repeat protein